MFKVTIAFSTLLFAGITSASAQLISIRTVPVSQEHQFEFFPARTGGMGGVSIAVDDAWLDPFTNPAKGARIDGSRFFGSPNSYSVSSKAGGGRSLPIGALAKSGSWYSGVWLTLQQIDMSEQPQFFPVSCPACEFAGGVTLPRQERTQGNTYAFALLGRQVAPGFSLAGSALWSKLNAIDGTDLLYAGSARIEQSGHAFDVRLAMLKEWSGNRSLEAIVLHNRYGTTHDVYYLDSFWDPGVQQFSQKPRLEKNLDRTRIYGLHVAYEQPLAADGWRGGVLATVNRMNHPKIPNYAIMNIPRDPGNSSAFNIGIGVSKTSARSTFGADLIYEPIWSHTWADAAAAVETEDGQIIPAGGMTIENHFRFSNLTARMGLDQQFALGTNGTEGGFQLGFAAHGIHYWLDQDDHVQLSHRDHEESWLEWRPTWGLNVRFPKMELRYYGTVTHGTGRPGIIQGGGFVTADAARAQNILVAPSGPLTLTEVKVVTHQVSISLPFH